MLIAGGIVLYSFAPHPPMPPPAPERDLSTFQIQKQPDDTTCGPTCLHAVYRYFGDEVSLAELLAGVPTLESGGTLGVLLATHALGRGYRARILTWNLPVFDPTWFPAERDSLRERLLRRARSKADPRLQVACRAYVDFLDAGGSVELHDLDPSLLQGFLGSGLPVLTGLSATFLYRESRERDADGSPDDVAGDPVGHFVVLTGHDPETGAVSVSDPLHPNPLATVHTYPVPMERVIGAIYLGVLSYDANLIVLEPGPGPRA